MKKMKIICTIITLIICSVQVNAQGQSKGIITGKVIDKVLNKPVEYANLILFSKKDSALVNGTISDVNGNYQMKDVPFGKYDLAVDFIGYERYVIPDIYINKENMAVNTGVINLEQKSEVLDEVQVVEEKNYVEYKIDKKVVNVSKNSSVQGGNAADALRSVPGVVVDAEGNVTIRGSSNFRVLVDGKPSVLSGSELLRQISASTIEKIEVITNPSVKYDPDGTAGIVNIIMKKGNVHNLGLNGIVNASVSTGDKYSGDFLFNYRKKDINYFIGGDLRYNTSPSQTELTRNTVADDSTMTMNLLKTLSDRNMIARSGMIKSGFDYYLNDNNTISLSGQFGLPEYERVMDSRFHEWDDPNTFHSYIFNDDDYDISGYYYFINFNYQKKFSNPGHEIMFNAFYNVWDGERYEYAEEMITDTEYDPLDYPVNKFRTEQYESRKEVRIKADYTLPVDSTGKFEGGFQGSLRPVNADFIFENFDTVSQDWILNSTFSNDLIFNNNIYAVYAMYSDQWKGIQYQAGIRGEYTDRLLELPDAGKKYLLERVDYFPSASLTKQIKKSGQVQLSYSRRINRPNEFFLNPLPAYSDKYIITLGNPDLLPEYIDSYELNYMKYLKTGFLSAEAYFRQTNNTFDRLFELGDDEILYVNTVNLDRQYAYGLTLSENVSVSKWLSIYSNVNTYLYQLQGDYITYDIPDVAASFDLFTRPTIVIKKKYRIQPYLGYNGPGYASQGRVNGFFNGGISVSAEFMKQKMTAVISIMNPFNIFDYYVDIKDPEFTSEFRMRTEANVVRLSLSYRINNYRPEKRNEEQMNNINQGGMF